MKFSTSSKNFFIYLTFLFFSLVLISCGKKENQTIQQNETLDEKGLVNEEQKSSNNDWTDFIPESVIKEDLLSSVVLSPQAGLNILGRDNKMHKMKTLPRGEILEIVYSGNEAQSINLYDTSEQIEEAEKYFHAVYDNVDFWIYAGYVAPNAVPAVVIQGTGNLRFGQIVAVSKTLPESEDSSNIELVYYFDEKEKQVCSLLLDAEKVSTYEDDVQTAEIVEKLRVTKKAVPRNELFLRAEKLNPSASMKKILDAEKTEKLSYDYQEVLKSMPGARYIVNVEELNTVDQSKDPFKN